MLNKVFKYFCISLFAGTAHSATISVSRGVGNPGIIAQETTNTGDPSTILSSGNYIIAIGSFTTVPTITSYSTLVTAVQSFNVFTTLPSPSSGATVGTITGSFTSTGGTTPELCNSQVIYFVVGNKSTLALSDQFGIFRTTANTTFPVNVATATSTSVSLPNGTVITPLANSGTVSGNNFLLVANPVPETSTSLLAVLGVFGLLRRRR
jgi:hypothetical protein